MKNFKRLISVLTAMLMCFALAVPCIAAEDEETTTITINESSVAASSNAANGIMMAAEGDEAAPVVTGYVGYKVLNATVSATDNTKVAYTIASDAYREVLKSAIATYTSDSSVTVDTSKDINIINYIGTLNDVTLTQFAYDLYCAIETYNAEQTDDTKKITAEKEAVQTNDGTWQLQDVGVGYWLVTNKMGTGDTSLPSTILFVKAVKDTTTDITPKTDLPTVEKKVEEGGNYQDWADCKIGDTVNFKLTATLTSEYAYYDKYQLIFHDTLSSGLTYTTDSAKAYAVIGDTTYTITNPAITSEGTALTFTYTDLKQVTKGTPVLTTEGETPAEKDITISGGTQIVIEYSAVLNNNAVVNNVGNPNTVELEYSNDPDSAGTGRTEPDTVKVFTYEVQIQKLGKTGESITGPLSGADFTLYKDGVAITTVSSGDTTNGVIKTVTGGTNFSFKGLDAGTYTIKETEVPAGYNKVDDITFTITPTIDNLVLTALSPNTDPWSATVSTDFAYIKTNIVNYSGTELPGTGGMGRTLIYLFGAALVLGTGVLLVTKKRMNFNK